MSSIKISPNASGTGEFVIAAPNSNTNRTLTLPDATGTINTSGAVNEVPAGSASAPSIYPTGDTNTGIFFPAADTIGFAEGGAEAMRINSSGNLLVGSSTATNNLRELENFGVVYTGGNAGGMALTGYPGIGTGYRPLLDFNRSRGSTVGSMTKVESGDNLGSIIFRGSDGTSFQDSAMISSEVDGATGSSDMPGRLTFWTVPDGSTSVTERMRIDSSGNVAIAKTTTALATLDVKGSISPTEAPSTAWGLQFAPSTSSGTYVTLTNDATYDLATGSGKVWIYEESGVGIMEGIAYYGLTEIQINPDSLYTVAENTANKINFYYNSGPGKYRIQNKTGVTVNLWVSTIGLRAST